MIVTKQLHYATTLNMSLQKLKERFNVALLSPVMITESRFSEILLPTNLSMARDFIELSKFEEGMTLATFLESKDTFSEIVCFHSFGASLFNIFYSFQKNFVIHSAYLKI